jgi:putative transposase
MDWSTCVRMLERLYRVRSSQAWMRDELLKLARQKPRDGYRRLHALLDRRGHAVNVKRVYRLYLEEGLSVRRKKRKRLVRDRAAEPRLPRAN